MYEARDFTPMPILADALQDAGCEDPDVLDPLPWHPASRPRLLGDRWGAGSLVGHALRAKQG